MNKFIERNIVEQLSRFSPAAIDDLNKLNLLRRYDTKFPTHISIVPDLLNELSGEYKVLEIDENRVFSYSSCYYDTDSYNFYMLHHNGRKNRLKVRNRKYVNSGECFLEIKQKNNSDVTNKSRINVDWHDDDTPLDAADFLLENADIDAESLNKKLIVAYKRVTLLNEEYKEKVTIDWDISFHNDSQTTQFGCLSIIELKHKSFGSQNKAFEVLKSLGLRADGGFSKYCMGLIITDQVSKYNRFKSNVLKLNKIIGK